MLRCSRLSLSSSSAISTASPRSSARWPASAPASSAASSPACRPAARAVDGLRQVLSGRRILAHLRFLGTQPRSARHHQRVSLVVLPLCGPAPSPDRHCLFALLPRTRAHADPRRPHGLAARVALRACAAAGLWTAAGHACQRQSLGTAHLLRPGSARASAEPVHGARAHLLAADAGAWPCLRAARACSSMRPSS